MRFVLVDLQIPGRKVNREHAGGFGAAMRVNGLSGNIVAWLKAQLIHLPILSMAYVASLLRKNGHQVLISHGETANADVALVATSLCAHNDELKFGRTQKSANPGCRVGYFGALPTTRPDLFEHGDFVVRGEVENIILNYLKGDHEFSGTLEGGLVSDLSLLEPPDWTGFKPHTFTYFPLLDKRPMLPVQSSRGCAYNCAYCAYMPVQTSRYRRRKPEAVVKEMIDDVHHFGARSFLFRDICFSLNRNHALAVTEGIRSRLPGVEWACETRVDCLDRELVDTMWEAGFRGVNLGIENPDEVILEKSGKRAPNFEHQMDIVHYMIEKGVRINAFYMLGLMGDTAESMARTISFAEKLNTLGAQYCVLTPFPGIPLYEKLENRLLTNDYSQFNEFTPVVNIGTASPDQVEDALCRAYRYYFRSDWLRKYLIATAFRAVRNMFGACAGDCQ